jgi:hypothetical protein
MGLKAWGSNHEGRETLINAGKAKYIKMKILCLRFITAQNVYAFVILSVAENPSSCLSQE